MLEFEKYLNDFNSTINIWSFALNLLIVTVIAYIIKLFYIRFGRAISDRRKFSNNFIPLALGTLLIITVIKSSIALSLGLVGALSIVRFRSAIKDPEELTMLFLIIGLGLIGGADKPILAMVSFALILPILYVNSRLAKTKNSVSNKAFLNIQTSIDDISSLAELIEPHTSYLEIKRVDGLKDGINASFLCALEDTNHLQQILNSVRAKDTEAKVSFVEQPELIL